MATEKLTHTLMYFSKEVRLRLHVSMMKEDFVTKQRTPNPFHTIFNFRGKEYVAMDFNAYITFEINDGEWEPSKSIMINNRNMYHILYGLKKAIDEIYKQDTFYIEDGEICIYRETAQERLVRLYNIGAHQDMVIIPAVVHDEESGQQYEGVQLLLNNSSNLIELTINQLETLYYILDKADLFEYGHRMLDTYFNIIKTHIGDHHMESNYVAKPNRQNIFEEGYKLRDGVTKSTLKKPQQRESDEDFFGV